MITIEKIVEHKLENWHGYIRCKDKEIPAKYKELYDNFLRLKAGECLYNLPFDWPALTAFRSVMLSRGYNVGIRKSRQGGYYIIQNDPKPQA